MMKSIFNNNYILNAVLLLAVVLGLVLRVYGLGNSGIFFYDEAMYYDHTLPVLDFISKHHLAGFSDWSKAAMVYLQVALSFTKPIWIFIVDSRCLLGQMTNWDYAKYASCLFGILTLPLMFLFSRRFFDSRVAAVLATALLAVLPSHVFYSRLGMQEAFSVFAVLLGFYFYLFPRAFGVGTFVAGFCLSLGFFANYRLIVLPLFLIFTELWFGFRDKGGIRWRHLVWACVTFVAMMVLVGSLMDGANTRFVFAWVFHQGDLAATKGAWTEFLAYPYYLFRLENVIFGALFFGSSCFLFKRDRKVSWLLALSCLQMLLFSMASDRGVRYMAIVLPFIVMAVVAVMVAAHDKFKGSAGIAVLWLIFLVMFSGLIVKSYELALASSDHERVVRYFEERSLTPRFLSSQSLVEGLYLDDRKGAQPLPTNIMDLQKYYKQGFHYLVLDPQAYVAFSANNFKWALPLKDYLGFVDQNIMPEKVFMHFNRAVMERFVFEHSDNLFQSIRFLNSGDLARAMTLRVYDLSRVMPVLFQAVNGAQKK
ncbi:MAG: phospholipid carrier-dependent glycosyltransferase [Candidatus Omnitrophica bacterium]|nr:phospholipid carrier-dependent glycosyltransferase [Candidatus Omnitrophota bacterium]